MSDADWHHCHFCGELVSDGVDTKGNRHYLSDCRPDLVEHEIGPLCTWSYSDKHPNCYAYQDMGTRAWGTEHIHFYNDGAM
jgi:hypothetical protein